MPASVIALDRACELAGTGDIWVFRGSSGADRAIRGVTNAPVNHVGMVIAVDDLPPLMWHAEMGRALPDLWSGTHHRGVQLHDLRDAVLQWGHRYGQRAWLRQLEGPVDRAIEDAALRAVARLDGTPFPSTARLAARWLRGRAPALRRRSRARDAEPVTGSAAGDPAQAPGVESAYCAEVVAVTYQEMGLLAGHRSPSWYDPGRFWSGDDLDLSPGFRLGGEIEVALPPAPNPRTVPARARESRWRRAIALR